MMGKNESSWGTPALMAAGASVTSVTAGGVLLWAWTDILCKTGN